MFCDSDWQLDDGERVIAQSYSVLGERAEEVRLLQKQEQTVAVYVITVEPRASM